MKKNIVTFCILLAFTLGSFSQQSPKDKGLQLITHDALVSQTTFLASDWTEGRETGERGAYMSADYIASMLQLFGAKPGGDFSVRYDQATRRSIQEQTYFQEFNLMKTSPGEVQELALILNSSSGKKVIKLNYMTDFIVSPSEPGGTIEAPVIFVGYGYRDVEKGWDDFSKRDIKGKFILRIAGLPSSLQSDNGSINNRGISSDKDQLAASLGAAGVIEVDPTGYTESQWTERKDFMNMSPSEERQSRPRTRYSIPQDKISDNIPRVNVSVRVANALLAGSGITLNEFIEKNLSPSAIKEPGGNSVLLSTSVNTSMVRVRNVVGVIEGKNRDEVLVLGAHYDHTGSFEGYINNGADDNASGTVGVLTIARAITGTGIQPEKTIVFALWTGEEKGLLGSRYYTNNPTVPLGNIKMNFNFDMISRYISDDTPNAITMTYTDSYPYFRQITEQNISDYKLEITPDYQPSNDPPGGTDHRSFVAKDIAIMRIKPGHREEYHTPADEISTLDWDIMEKIVQLSFLNVWDLANSKW